MKKCNIERATEKMMTGGIRLPDLWLAGASNAAFTVTPVKLTGSLYEYLKGNLSLLISDGKLAEEIYFRI